MIAAGFVVAAAVGTLARWQLGLRLPRPYGTLLVNLAGAFLLGVMEGADPPELTVFGVAGLGALTTFSTVARELLEFWASQRTAAVAYGAATAIGGIGAALLGIALS